MGRRMGGDSRLGDRGGEVQKDGEAKAWCSWIETGECWRREDVEGWDRDGDGWERCWKGKQGRRRNG